MGKQNGVRNNQAEPPTSEEALSGAAGSPRQDTAAGSETQDLRIEKIREYAIEALEKANGLESLIAVVNSDLMSLTYRLRQALENALAGAAHSLEAYQQLMPLIQTLQKLTSQITQLAQLERRMSSDRQAAVQRTRERPAALRSEESTI